MIYEKLRNYDVAMRKHVAAAFARPKNMSTLPVHAENPAHGARDDDGDGQRTDMSTQSEADSNVSHCDLSKQDHVVHAPDTSSVRRPAATECPLSVHCGDMPMGCSLDAFHAPPAQVHVRNAEGRYWQDFESRLQRAKVPYDGSIR